MPRRTALIVVVPEAQPHVLITHVPAHVTILFPFVDADDVDEQALRTLFAEIPAFDFTLVSQERWPDVVWLRPDPSEPFAELTRRVWERWPDYPPYEGVHETVIPHLTVSDEDVDVTVPLPIASHAHEVTLIEETADGRWAVRRRFPLYGSRKSIAGVESSV